MKPFLFAHTFFETPTYFVVYLLAFLGAILLGTRKAVRDGLSPVRAVDIGMAIFVSGVFGARLFHILFEAPGYYFTHPERVFYFWQGGFILYGGILFGILGTIIFLRLIKEPIGKWADVVAPCMLLGIGIGRIGCLAAGCCYGKPTDLFWGIVFMDPRGGAPLHMALHPTQSLEILFGFLASLAFWFIFSGPTRRPGVAFAWALIAYATFRFLVEYLRGDPDRGLYFGGALSISQIISVLVFAGAAIWLSSKKFSERFSK